MSVAVSTLGVEIGHMESNLGKVALVPVSSQLSTTLLLLIHPFPSSFRWKLTDMIGIKSSFDMQSSLVLGSHTIHPEPDV